jgi:hypothetical protein
MFTNRLTMLSMLYNEGSIFIFNGIFKQYNDKVKRA